MAIFNFYVTSFVSKFKFRFNLFPFCPPERYYRNTNINAYQDYSKQIKVIWRKGKKKEKLRKRKRHLHTIPKLTVERLFKILAPVF